MSTTTAAQPADESADPSTSTGHGLRRIPKGKRLTGEAAEQFTRDVISAYKSMAIHEICEVTGRSYGAIHRLLVTNGVAMRPRGSQPRSSAGPADAS
ncbi:helix-turn-helix domain-containing protein [Streptomyces rubiginosohelvolus]|uniref:Helix-turn-helix domain-containing protein n=1 Tax=Streptomyces rubiginosohelvolus TaxID=67362 RepID=A0ABW6EXH5_9ACTN